MHFRFLATDKGQREKNEDAGLIKRSGFRNIPISLAVVCDGMGGLENGEKASALACILAREWFSKEIIDRLDERKTIHRREIYDSMLELVEKTDTKLRQVGEKLGSPCGTTMCLILLLGDKFYTLNIGDSRAYVIRYGEIHRITKDQSYGQELLDAGVPEEEILKNKDRFKLTQCLGAGAKPVPVFSSASIKPGDLFFAATDGFLHQISELEMAISYGSDRTQTEDDLARATLFLIGLNRERYEKDNITVAVIKVEDGEQDFSTATLEL